MSKIFNADTFGIPQDHDEDNDDAAHTTSSYQAPVTEHAKDAIDYSDFNEAVPDDQLFSNKYYQRGMGVLQTKTQPSSRLRVISDDYDEEDESVTDIKPEPVSEQPSSSNIHALNAPPPTTSAPPPSTQPAVVDIKELFPAFEHNKVLKFSELFMTKLQPSSKLQPNKRGIILYHHRHHLLHLLIGYLEF